VQFEMEYPAFWAWHYHSRANRIAHGAVYATYVGTWRKRFRIVVATYRAMMPKRHGPAPTVPGTTAPWKGSPLTSNTIRARSVTLASAATLR
jgi:hypothetical protein